MWRRVVGERAPVGNAAAALSMTWRHGTNEIEMQFRMRQSTSDIKALLSIDKIFRLVKCI